MSSRAWALDLATTAYRRGWLTRGVQEKIRFLLERGLHPEQIFLGMGLLTVTRYSELIRAQFQVDIQRLDQDYWHLEAVSDDLPETIRLARAEDGASAWLVADLWEDAQTEYLQGQEGTVGPVLLSDLLRWGRRQEPTDFAVSAWWEAWQAQPSTEARICIEANRGQVWVGSDAISAPDLQLAREEVPALQTWFEAGYPASQCRVKRIPGLESDLLQVVTAAPHPLERLAGWQQFMEAPEGVCVCLAPDAWVLQALESIPLAPTSEALFAGVAPQRIHPRTETEREQAWHAALSGNSFYWIEEIPQETSWLRALAQARVPLLVVRRRETLHGSAWEAYPISYDANFAPRR